MRFPLAHGHDDSTTPETKNILGIRSPTCQWSGNPVDPNVFGLDLEASRRRECDWVRCIAPSRVEAGKGKIATTVEQT